MFTGLISHRARLVRAAPALVLELEEAPLPGKDTLADTLETLETLELGQSVSCDGCCLTITHRAERRLHLDVSPETLQRTIWPRRCLGDRINLEFPLRMGDRLDGHLVTGHIDGLVEVLHREPMGVNLLMRLATPEALRPFICSKGSVALNGVALTVNEVQERVFSVMLIPATCRWTNLPLFEPGSYLNLEIDLIARYIHHNLRLRGVSEPFKDGDVCKA